MRLTANEATIATGLAAAVISSIVSFVVARYTLKNGPDYQKQLNDLRAEMARVSAAQEALLAHQRQLATEDRERRASLAWRPGISRIESQPDSRTNMLVVASNEHFHLVHAELLTESGVRVSEIPVAVETGQMVQRVELPIPEAAIHAVTSPDPAYHQLGKTVGKLSYGLRVGVLGDELIDITMPIRLIREMSGSALWVRLDG